MLRTANRKLWTSGRLDKLVVPGHGDGVGYALPSAGHGPSGYGAAVLALSPLAYYKFDEPSGTTATDASGNGHNGTYTTAGGTITLGNAGKVDGNSCLTIAGTSGNGGYVDCGNLNSFATYTIGGWVNWDGTAGSGGWCGLFGKTAYNTDWASIFNTSTKEIRIYHASATQAISYTYSALASSTWFHYMVTYNGTTATLYLNGSSVATGSTATAPGGTSNSLRIGAESAGAYRFEGKLDDWAVWTSALSGSSVAALYAAS